MVCGLACIEGESVGVSGWTLVWCWEERCRMPIAWESRGDIRFASDRRLHSVLAVSHLFLDYFYYCLGNS